MLQYNLNKKFSYVGRSIDLGVRLRTHFNRSSLSKNKLGLFLNLVGWSNISVYILELTTEKEIIQKENWYLKKYLPVLNSHYFSNSNLPPIAQTSVAEYKKSYSLRCVADNCSWLSWY